ncbi:MAG: ATPase, T2SS/T4P/T4SS family [Candidatus Jordarchaeaceae archaeon]
MWKNVQKNCTKVEHIFERRENDEVFKLIFKCSNNCENKNEADPRSCANCMSECLSTLEKEKEKDIDEMVFYAPTTINIFNKIQTKYLLELAEAISKLYRDKAKFKKLVPPNCPNGSVCEDRRKMFLDVVFGSDGKTALIYQDPIRAYLELKEGEFYDRLPAREGRLCSQCYDKFMSVVVKFIKTLEGTKIVERYNNLKIDLKNKPRSVLYNYLLSPIRMDGQDRNYETEAKDRILLDAYEVGPYSVTIYLDENSTERFYCVDEINTKTYGKNILNEEIDELRSSQILTDKRGFFKTDGLTKIRKSEALNFLRIKYPEIPSDSSEKIAEIFSYESIGIGAIAPFLLDSNVEEFYLDKESTNIYLDHRKWGRCRTSVSLTEQDIERIITRVRAESDMQLDESKPSLKTEIITDTFHVRISIDIPPLAAEGVQLDCRKLRKNPFTIPELIANGTLNAQAASYLLFCLLRRINITVIGESGAGKTTLINALDILTPQDWRKIYVEDVIESIPQTEYEKHQTRFKVEPFEGDETKRRNKSKEITRLLHRSPDWVFLGEIQTAQDSQAMFHALSSGITGLQTCHGASVEDMILRWVVHHDVSPACLRDLSIIVQINRMKTHFKKERKVVRICEIDFRKKEMFRDIQSVLSEDVIVDVFTWKPKIGELVVSSELFTTPTLEKIKSLDYLEEKSFLEELETYEQIFMAMSEERIFDLQSNINIFHSLYALLSEQEIERGVINWEEVREIMIKKIKKLKKQVS